MVVRRLLEKGAKLESKDDVGMTPLSWAAKNGHEATVELLSAKDGFDRTPRMKIVGRYCRWQLKTGMRRL